jgi:predicted transcriptional regulator
MLSEKNILKLEKRKKIYDFIDKNPGLNIREISRKLNIPLTSLIYHLNYLKKLNLIIERQEGKYKKIFISYKIGADDKKILGLLRNKNSSKILLYLFLYLSCSQIEISRELNIPHLQFHII